MKQLCSKRSYVLSPQLSAALIMVGMQLLGQTALAQSDAWGELAHRVAVDAQGDPAQLSHYIRCFQDATFQDPRIFAFQVAARESEDGCIVLTGYVEFSEIRAALRAFLRRLGFEDIQDETALLPAKELGKRRYGLVTSTHCLVLTRPQKSAETATDALLGEPLVLLCESAPGFLLCHTADGYLGHIQSEHVLRVDGSAFAEYQAGKQVRIEKDWRQDDLTLPIGTHLPWASQTADAISVQLPAGRRVKVPVGAAVVLDDAPHAAIERVLTTANQFLGTKYVWGGKTTAGVDCSGLVQTAFAASGVHLARDANQQLITGKLTATRWWRTGMRRGDTLYFMGGSGKISHTGIYLGDHQYIEAVRPIVRISSLNPKDQNYSLRGDTSLAFAKRLLE